MDKMKIGITICLAAALFFAGESHALIMGPSRFEVSLPPGEFADGDYYVQNDTDQPAHIVVEPENWFKDVYDYGKLEIKDWVEFDTYAFDLKPKEIKKLRLRIKVPKNVKGELVSQIFFTSTVLREDGQPVEGIRARIGAVLYVAIKGTEVIEAEIKNIDILKEPIDGKERIKIGVGVNNKGNVHVRPEGKVAIEDISGKKLVELDLEPGKPALPGQEIVYNALWNDPDLKSGDYKALITINYGKDLDMEKTGSSERIFKIGKDGKVTIR